MSKLTKEQLSAIRAAAGRRGGKQSSEAKTLAARENGRLGGLVSSEAKTLAVRQNARLGGLATKGISSEAKDEQLAFARSRRKKRIPKPKPRRDPKTGKVKRDFWY